MAILVTLSAGCDSRPVAPPHVLLISIDTLRADRLGCYGHGAARTPTLDGLAAEGLRFEQVSSPVPLTLPAHASLFSSQWPTRHGVRLNSESRLEDSAITLAERLQAAGYRTGAFIGATPLDRAGGLAQGFAHYDDRMGPGQLEREAGQVFEAALSWLSDDEAGPHFLFVHLFDPHWPHERALPGAAKPSYDGEVAYVDGQLARFLEQLRRRPGWEEPLIMITADHGEGLGEHGESSHGLLLYETTLRVPWIVHWPGRVDPRRVEAPVSLVDVTPTLLELLGLDPIPDVDGVPVHVSANRSRPLYFESLYGQLEFGWAALRGVRRDGFKYIEGARAELFDLEVDPGESTDRVHSRPDEASELARRLTEFGEGETRATPIDEEARARLRSLGYVSARPGVMPGTNDRIDPREAIGRFERYMTAVALVERGRFEEARAALEIVRDDFDGSAAYMIQLGRCDAGLERWVRAGEHFERAAEIDPSHTGALLDLAVTRIKRRLPAEAEQALLRLVSLDANHAEAHYLLGTLRLWALDRSAEGVESWQRLLWLDPNHPRAQAIARVIAAYERGERSVSALRRAFTG